MKLRILAGAMLAFAPIASAAAMPVSTFLVKADKLQKKGALAMFSGDLKLLMGQVKADAAELRAENKAAAAAGRPKAYCTPPQGVKLSNRDILGAMRAVPPAERARTSTKQALRSYFVRRFPCPAKT
jgi:surface antigen